MSTQLLPPLPPPPLLLRTIHKVSCSIEWRLRSLLSHHLADLVAEDSTPPTEYIHATAARTAIRQWPVTLSPDAPFTIPSFLCRKRKTSVLGLRHLTAKSYSVGPRGHDSKTNHVYPDLEHARDLRRWVLLSSSGSSCNGAGREKSRTRLGHNPRPVIG